jgi:hypothetical protein
VVNHQRVVMKQPFTLLGPSLLSSPDLFDPHDERYQRVEETTNSHNR